MKCWFQIVYHIEVHILLRHPDVSHPLDGATSRVEVSTMNSGAGTLRLPLKLFRCPRQVVDRGQRQAKVWAHDFLGIGGIWWDMVGYSVISEVISHPQNEGEEWRRPLQMLWPPGQSRSMWAAICPSTTVDDQPDPFWVDPGMRAIFPVVILSPSAWDKEPTNNHPLRVFKMRPATYRVALRAIAPRHFEGLADCTEKICTGTAGEWHGSGAKSLDGPQGGKVLTIGVYL